MLEIEESIERTAKTVLVTDDDEDIRESMRDVLDSEGFDVALAENGRVALAYLHEHPDDVAVILLDLMMPVMDGAEFHDAQHQDPRFADIPVVIVTAGGAAAAFPAAMMLLKPVAVDTLVGTVSRFAPRRV